MKTVASQFARAKPDARWEPSLGPAFVPDDLKRVARAFVVLQEARHGADYDVSRTFTREETLAYVEEAGQAFEAVARIRTTVPGEVFLFALLLQRAVNA